MLTCVRMLQPTTLDEAYELITTRHKTAPLLAGGCWLRLGKRQWPAVIDLTELELEYIVKDGDEYAIGAMTTQRDVETYEAFQNLGGGILPQALSPILGVQFRNMATIGGSVAGRFGFSDIIPALLALKADVVLYKAGRMSLEDYLTYDKRDILIEVRIKCEQPAVALMALRKSASDFPYLVGAMRHDAVGYSIYVGGRPGVAVKAKRASSILTAGRENAVAEAGEAAAAELFFESNSHASASYRQAMTKVLIERLWYAVTTVGDNAGEVPAWK